jgi:hypothetical protein
MVCAGCMQRFFRNPVQSQNTVSTLALMRQSAQVTKQTDGNKALDMYAAKWYKLN